MHRTRGSCTPCSTAYEAPAASHMAYTLHALMRHGGSHVGSTSIGTIQSVPRRCRVCTQCHDAEQSIPHQSTAQCLVDAEQPVSAQDESHMCQIFLGLLGTRLTVGKSTGGSGGRQWLRADRGHRCPCGEEAPEDKLHDDRMNSFECHLWLQLWVIDRM